MKRTLAKIDRGGERMINLLVGGDGERVRIPVYNQILKCTSPKFKSLVEAMAPETPDLEIPGISKGIITLLIEYIYKTFDDREPSLLVTGENVYEITTAANFLELTDVESLCLNYLNSMDINSENCIYHFLKTRELAHLDFKRKCLDLVLSSLEHLYTTLEFINLSFMQLVYIIREGRATKKCSEDLLCEASLNWLKNGDEGRKVRTKELLEEFPSKKHKQLILQILYNIPDSIFDLISGLHKDANKTMATTAAQTTTEIEINCSRSEGNAVINRCDASTQTTGLKRSVPAPTLQSEGSSCSQPKKNKSQLANVSDEIPSSSASSLNGSDKNNMAVASGGGCSVSSSKCCSGYFLATNEGSCQLFSFNLHNFDFKAVTASVPDGLAGLNFSSVQYFQGKIYFMGGKSDTRSKNDVHIYSIDQDSWEVKKMLQARHSFPSIRLDNWMFAVGGLQKISNKKPVPTNSVERLDLKTYEENGEWKQVAEMSTFSRKMSGLVVFNRRIYSIGGATTKSGGHLAESGMCNVFDPQSTDDEEPWKLLKAVLLTPRFELLAIATENKIFAIGGRTNQMARLTTVEILREGSDVWEVGPSLIKPRSFACGGYCKKENAIFVFGGDVSDTPSVERLDLNTNKWSVVCKKSLPCRNHKFKVFSPCS